MGMPGRVWARCFLPVASDSLVEAWSGRAQESEREWLDTVEQAGGDKRGREHEGGMTCHGMDALGQGEQAPVLGR
jgi:hypothetical protein